MQLPAPGEVCDALTVVNVDDGPFRLTDGSTGFNAYHSGANCVGRRGVALVDRYKFSPSRTPPSRS